MSVGVGAARRGEGGGGWWRYIADELKESVSLTAAKSECLEMGRTGEGKNFKGWKVRRGFGAASDGARDGKVCKAAGRVVCASQWGTHDCQLTNAVES